MSALGPLASCCRSALRLLALLCVALPCAHAHGQPAPSGATVAVYVSPEGEAERTIRRLLEVALRARGIQAVQSETDPSLANADAVAILSAALESDGEGHAVARARITVRDALYDKRVERTLDLSQLPPDGVPLAVAASADELLRASWAEMTLRDAPPSRAAVPQEVSRAVAQTRSPPAAAARRALEVGLAGGGLLFTHWASLDASLRVLWHVSDAWSLGLAGGYAVASARSSENGRVDARAPHVELSGGRELLAQDAPLGLALEVPLLLFRPAFLAQPESGSAGRSFDDWALVSGLRLRAHMGRGPLRLWLSGGALFGLRGAEARDEGERVLALRRLGGQVLAGASLLF